MVALTFVTTHTKWSGQLNPWKNLEFLQKGGQFYNPQTEHEIQEVLARNQRQKKELGLDNGSINATADNQAETYRNMIEKAKKITDTQNTIIAKRFAYHYLFKNK